MASSIMTNGNYPILTQNALTIVEDKYLMRSENGTISETPEEMFRRVVKYVSSDPYEEQQFYEELRNLRFLPNTPTWIGAFHPRCRQLFACFVLPFGDSVEEMWETAKNAAIIHQSGGGTGISLGKIRPKGDLVKSSGKIASGPVSFMRLIDVSTDTINQAGRRRGANMVSMPVHHPDIIKFIRCKDKEGDLSNINISVMITDAFMDAVKRSETFDLINPRDEGVWASVPAREIWDAIIYQAWKNGEPGVQFYDRVNRDNPTPVFGPLEASNPCGESFIYEMESCVLGSINLSKFYKDGIDWDGLEHTIGQGIRFLDLLVDKNGYPLRNIKKVTQRTRKIGLGVMGFADLLYKMRISYDSPKAVELAGSVMKFINEAAGHTSTILAEEKGLFPAWEQSVWRHRDILRRNAVVTTIAPTGTISLLANCSGGIEPNFGLCYKRMVVGNDDLWVVNEVLEDELRKRDLYTDEMLDQIFDNGGSINGISGLEDLWETFVIARQVSPDQHVRIQAAFQSHTENAVSKTVNLPNEATREDVSDIFRKAHGMGVKGVTVYRDGSRETQVLTTDKSHCVSEACDL